jgi:hypothetical protein
VAECPTYTSLTHSLTHTHTHSLSLSATRRRPCSQDRRRYHVKVADTIAQNQKVDPTELMPEWTRAKASSATSIRTLPWTSHTLSQPRFSLTVSSRSFPTSSVEFWREDESRHIPPKQLANESTRLQKHLFRFLICSRHPISISTAPHVMPS